MAAAGTITLKNTSRSPWRIRFKADFIDRAKELLGDGSDGALYLVPAVPYPVPREVYDEARKSKTFLALLDKRDIVQVVEKKTTSGTKAKA